MTMQLLDTIGVSPYPTANTMYTGAIQSTGRLQIPQIAPVVSATWPTANLAMFYPFIISAPIVANGMGWLNGTVSSGNIDAGIYDAAGNRLAHTGSTAQGTAVAEQSASISATYLAPGTYFMAIAMDNTTGRFYSFQAGGSTLLHQAAGVQQMATAFTLPSTATFANPANKYIVQMAVLVQGTF